MKKLICIIFAVFLVFSISACGTKEAVSKIEAKVVVDLDKKEIVKNENAKKAEEIIGRSNTIEPPMMIQDEAVSSQTYSNKIKTEKYKVSVTSKEIVKDNEFITMNIKIPVIDGLEDLAVQEKVNSIIESDIKEYKDNLISSAESNYKQLKEMNIERPVKYVANTDYRVTYNKGNILSIVVKYEEYTGGAHGNHSQKGFNIDLDTGKEAMLDDFFYSGEDYDSIILNEIKRQMKNEPSKYYTDSLDKVTSMEFNHPYYLEADNIVVFYGLYELAPFAAGISEFRIPFSLFKNGVKEKIDVKTSYLKVKNKIEYDTNDTFEYHLRIPILYNLDDVEFESKLNEIIKNEIYNYKDTLYKYKLENDDILISMAVDYQFSYINRDSAVIQLKYSKFENGQREEGNLRRYEINLKDYTFK